MMKLSICVFIQIASFLIQPLEAGQSKGMNPFSEATRFQLGGDGGWDYLTMDSVGQRLYIARSNRVMVIDTETGKEVGEVSGTDGVHGIALVPKLHQGFASAGKAGTVVAFDTKTLKQMGQITVGQNPDAILYDPASQDVFAFNGKSKSASVIDPKTQKVVATIPLAGKPEFGATDDAGKVFVNLEDQNALAVIDSRKLSVIGQYDLKPCEEPTGLSIDAGTHHLFVGCGNKIAAVVDSETGKVVKTFPVGQGVDATAFDSKRKLAFISAGEGRLSIIRESGDGNFELIQDLKTQKGARTLAVDSESGKVFLATAQFGPPEAPKPGQKHGRPSILPDSFVILVVGH